VLPLLLPEEELPEEPELLPDLDEEPELELLLLLLDDPEKTSLRKLPAFVPLFL
jgi:hypothetical protein